MRISFFNRLFSSVFVVMLALVGNVPFGLAHAKGVESAKAAEKDGEKAVPTPPLTTEIIFNVLVGEVALQRQELDLAFSHQLQAAQLAEDAIAAERAARIALHQKNHTAAREALELWIRFSSEDIKARQMSVMLHMQADSEQEALEQLRILVKLGEKTSKDGFMQAIPAVTSGQNKSMALSLMKTIASEYPKNARANYAVALAAVMAHDLEYAKKEVSRAIKLKPKMERAYILLGRVHMEAKEPKKALQILKNGIGALPKSTAMRSSYARMLVDQGKSKQAFNQFRRLLTMLPGDANIQFSLGILALQLDRRKQAAVYFSNLIKANKRVTEASFYMGRIDEAAGKHKDALAWYSKVNAGNYFFDARARTAGLLAKQGEMEKARSILAGLRASMPKRSIDLYILEGELLRKHSTNDKVVELYNAALEDHPEDIDLLYARALSASQEGRVDILERDIRFILERKPDHADALNALGYTLADQTDRHQEALGYIKKALELKPDSPAILDSMGWVQYRLGNNKEALRYLRRAFSKLQDVEIAAHLGELLWVTGKKKEARKILQGAKKKHPENKYLLQAIKRLGI